MTEQIGVHEMLMKIGVLELQKDRLQSRVNELELQLTRFEQNQETPADGGFEIVPGDPPKVRRKRVQQQ